MAHHRKEIQSDFTYGRRGTPTSKAFEEVVAKLYNGGDCISTPSGLSAITVAILSVLKSNDHAIFPDNIYGSTRNFILEYLPKINVNYDFYNPCNLTHLSKIITKNTKLIYIESPGSLTFELTDIKSIIKIANKQNIKIPHMGVINDMAPNAFTYGHTPNNARIVITKGLFFGLYPKYFII